MDPAATHFNVEDNTKFAAFGAIDPVAEPATPAGAAAVDEAATERPVPMPAQASASARRLLAALGPVPRHDCKSARSKSSLVSIRSRRGCFMAFLRAQDAVDGVR